MRALVLAALVACSSGAPPAPAPPVASGSRVETKTFDSAALGVAKSVVVYLPKGYGANAATKYPVFYYLHGLTGNETNWTQSGNLQAAADALNLQAIVVMPDADDGFYTDAVTPRDHEACLRDGTGLFVPLAPKNATCVKRAAYETYIVKDLVSWVDATYQTNTSREGRAIAGLSMGGYGALVLAFRHPELFAATASHSGVDSLLYRGPRPYAGKATVQLIEDPARMVAVKDPIVQWFVSIWGTDLANWKAHDPVSLAEQLAPGKLAIYLDVGEQDDLALDDRARYLHDVLVEKNIEHEWFTGPGGHNFLFWKARLPASLAFLASHTAAAK